MRLLGRLLTILTLLGAVLGLAAAPVGASSHREAPYISTDPTADDTDLYAFVSPDDPSKVTFIVNVVPLEVPPAGPNFYKFGDDVLYELNIDNDGDARDDLTYQFRFHSVINKGNTFLYNTGPVTSKSDPDLNQEQFYDVSVRRPGDPRIGRTIGRNLQVAPANVGPVSFPDYAAVASQFVYSIDGDIKVFAGPRDDPFFVDLGGTFDLLHPRGKDDLAGLNVHSIAIQVPIAKLTANHQLPSGASDPNAILGVYTTASRQSMRVLRQLGAPGSSATQPVANSGPWVQISRLDLPLINEVVIPLKDKDRWNGSEPENDSQFLQYARTPELAGLIQAILGVTVPPTPRTDLLTILFKGIPGLNQPKNVVPATLLRLNVAIPPTASPNRLGVLGGDLQGFPNGRRLADDVVDIELQAVAGATPLTPDFNKAPNNTLGDGVNANDCAFASAFPYLANPHDYARRCGVSAP